MSQGEQMHEISQFFGVIFIHTCPKSGLVYYESRESARNMRYENSSKAISEMYP